MGRLVSFARSRARTALTLIVAFASVDALALPRVAFAQAAGDAKSSLAEGDKAARAKDWAKAQAAYEAAYKAEPSADALEGIANAHYQSKRDGEAYLAYDEWKRTFGPKAPKGKAAAVDARLKELGDRTGELSVALDDAAAGATVTVDDKPIVTSASVTGAAASGKTLVTRLTPGPHRVRVTKEGFAAFDQVPNVAAGASTRLDVKLEAQTTKGRISVKEKSGKPIRVTVDGVDMGDAPWTGEVEAGTHDVAGRGAGLVAAPEKVTVERGKTRDVELVASASTATIKISTSDGKGAITLDGKPVGEGTFTSEIPSGPHTVRITREGFEPFEEQLDLKPNETLARSITLKLSSKVETGEVKGEGRRVEGVYGGFSLLYTGLPSGMNHSMQKTCEASDKPVELTSCEGIGGSSGGGVNGFIGYHWDPVGVEFHMGFGYDQGSPTLTWAASSTDPGFGPDPARTEEFNVRRLGGHGAFRIRLTHQWEKIRLTAAAGVGLAYRVMLLDRDTTAAANTAFRDVLVSDGQGYLSPVLSFEPAAYYRITPTTAVGLGLSLLVESPSAFDQIPTQPAEGGHRLGPSGITTPRYELASGTQVYMGPFIGMMFGP